MEAVLEAHQRRLTNLQNLRTKTEKIESDIRHLLDKKPTQLKLGQDLSQNISLGVLGRPNCGKSSLINELLHQDILPVSDTATPSRVVSILYSDLPYIRLLHKDGDEVEGSKKELTQSPETQDLLRTYIIRDSSECMLDKTTEIGLNHPMLKLGLEFLDLPAVEDIQTTKDLMTIVYPNRCMPILVYLIDGNMSLRSEDLHTIQFFRENYPDVQLMYAGNKMEVDKAAAGMDEPSGSSSDSDSETIDLDQLTIGFDLSDQKFKSVLDGLRSNEIPVNEASSGCFHGMSMHHVKQARMENATDTEERFLSNFEIFKSTLVDCIDKHSRTSVKEVLIGLKSELVCHQLASLYLNLSAEKVDKAQKTLALDIEEVKSADSDILESMKTMLQGERQEVQSVISDMIAETKERLISGIDNILQAVPACAASIHLKILVEDIEKYVKHKLHEIPAHFQRYLEYLSLGSEVRNRIINSIIRQSDKLEKLTTKAVSNIRKKLNKVIATLRDPVLDTKDLEVISMLEILSTKILPSLKKAILNELLEVFNTQYMIDTSVPFFEKHADRQPAREDAEKMLDLLMSKFDAETLTNMIISKVTQSIETYCTEGLQKALRLVLSLRQELVSKSKKLATIMSLMLPNLAEVEVENRSIEYEAENGPMLLGEPIKIMERHGSIFPCPTEWYPNDGNEYIVREVTTSWKQTISRLYYTIFLKSNKHLLKIGGWWLPRTETLYIVQQMGQFRLDEASIRSGQHMQIALDVAQGIQTVHSSGLIFNNIEPQSIMMMPDQRAALDICEGDYEPLRAENEMVDIQALGHLLLWLLRDADDEGDTAQPPVPATKPISCSEELWKVIQACLETGATIKDILNMIQPQQEK
ncbi:dual serine/threonine and tyrosine protein kinase-like [Ptychodera flava]|uniref:dual serine/threonine and tyrosine protein kinase-like n=1 Tax=Ptychodera flava TaxID=63121 RepID=UPI00396AAEB0